MSTIKKEMDETYYRIIDLTNGLRGIAYDFCSEETRETINRKLSNLVSQAAEVVNEIKLSIERG